MPGVLILVAPALLVAGGLLTWAAPALKVPANLPGALGSWAALAALIAAWFAVGREMTTVGEVLQAVTLPPLLQIDAARFATGIVLVVAHGLLLTLRRPPPIIAALGTLAAACALIAVEAGSLALLAVAVGAAALLLVALHREEGGRLRGGFSGALVLATVALLIAAAAVLANAGTTAYAAIPVSSYSTGAFLLLVLAALCLTGVLPWPSWVSACLERPRPDAAAVTLTLLTPLGLFLLLETTQLGAGSWPRSWLHGVVACWAGVSLITAGFRAQAAGSRRRVLRELALMQTSVAAIALSLGTPFGIGSGLVGMAASTLAQLTSVVLPVRGRLGVLGFALTAGAPPGLAFASIALTAEATLEMGAAAQLLVLLLGAGWLLGIVAAIRAVRLPALQDQPRWGGFPVGALALAGGALLGPLEGALMVPAASTVVPSTTFPAPLTLTSGSVVAASGGWGALALGVLTIAFVALAPLFTRPLPDAPPAAPAPALLPIPELTPLDGLAWFAARIRLRPPGWDRALERLQLASERGPVWLWAAIAFVLAIVVTR